MGRRPAALPEPDEQHGDERPAALVTVAFVLLGLASFGFFAGVGVLLPTLPRLVRNELGGGDVAVGTAVAVYSAAAICCRPAVAWWVRTRGYRSALRSGALLGAAATAACSLAGSLPVVVVLRMVGGTAEALFFVGLATIVNEGAPVARRAEAASLNSVGLFVGLGLGPVAGRALVTAGHARGAFLLAGGLMTLGAALGWRAAGAPSAPVRRAVRASASPATVPAAAGRPFWHDVVHPAAAWPGLGMAFAVVGYAGWSAFLSLRADQVGGVDDGRLFLLYSVVSIVVRLVGARLPERIGLGRCVMAALVVLVAALAAASAVDGPGGLWASAALVGLGIALLYPSLLALTLERVPDAGERGVALSSFTMFFEVGVVLGGVLTGAVAGWAGYRAAFAAGAVVSAAGLPVVWFGVLRRRPAPGALTPV